MKGHWIKKKFPNLPSGSIICISPILSETEKKLLFLKLATFNNVLVLLFIVLNSEKS